MHVIDIVNDALMSEFFQHTEEKLFVQTVSIKSSLTTPHSLSPPYHSITQLNKYTIGNERLSIQVVLLPPSTPPTFT